MEGIDVRWGQLLHSRDLTELGLCGFDRGAGRPLENLIESREFESKEKSGPARRQKAIE